MAHDYRATVEWRRASDAKFTDQRYSRAHQWSFDGGITIPASSSPLSVRLPYSVAEAVDPEEALVAALASCHMLTFLYVAAKQGFGVHGAVFHAAQRQRNHRNDNESVKNDCRKHR